MNTSRNVNVDVDSRGGCCGGGWDNDYHPVATAAAITATAAVIGSMVRTVPANCVPVNYGGIVFQQCGSAWYQPQGGLAALSHAAADPAARHRSKIHTVAQA